MQTNKFWALRGRRQASRWKFHWMRIDDGAREEWANFNKQIDKLTCCYASVRLWLAVALLRVANGTRNFILRRLPSHLYSLLHLLSACRLHVMSNSGTISFLSVTIGTVVEDKDKSCLSVLKTEEVSVLLSQPPRQCYLMQWIEFPPKISHFTRFHEHSQVSLQAQFVPNQRKWQKFLVSLRKRATRMSFHDHNKHSQMEKYLISSRDACLQFHGRLEMFERWFT